ncbi:MAG: TIGR01777 family oxidoreductase [Bacteroidota bacterium]
MKILIAGGSGFIGQSIINNLILDTPLEFHILTRTHRENHDNVHYHQWDGKNMGSWKVFVDHCDILINLAGRSVKCRYNAQNKNEIYDSRIDSTFILGEAVSRSKNPPKLWFNASTATIYRHERIRANDEYNGILGHGFSEDVAKKWEEIFYSSYTPFTRKIALRSALVFGKEGEVFNIYKNHINLGLSGRHGSGNQMVSWIHELDFVRAIEFLINSKESHGSYNLSAPHAVTDKVFLGTFRRLMGIRYAVPVPEWALTIGAYFCGAETEMLLKSRWAYPKRLLEEGFEFEFDTHTKALKELLRERRKNKWQPLKKEKFEVNKIRS